MPVHCRLLVAAFRRHRSLFSSTRRMSHQAPDDGAKLIFAPAGRGAPLDPSIPGQAAQFTKHEDGGGLRRQDLDATDPIKQFMAWFKAAADPADGAGTQHPETCTLSTASLPSGRVSARSVYMKELDPHGFVVYTNLATSRKARDLDSNPWASLVFHWEHQERQVRVEGKTQRLVPEANQKYFDTRVRESRIGAWASQQSVVLQPDPSIEGDDGRAQLDGWLKEMEAKFEGVEKILVPEYWGGLRIKPERIEFWQGRRNRLHDRFVYEGFVDENGKGTWKLERLSP